MNIQTHAPVLSAEEAAALIPHDAMIGFSGFTSAGAAKAVPRALAQRAKALHAAQTPFKLKVLAGASTGKSVDSALAEANAISSRVGYQSSRELRKQINAEEVDFIDIHLSHLPQMVQSGSLGKLDFAVIEATEYSPDGRVYLSTSIGASPTYLECADKVIIEINRYHSPRLSEMTDILSVKRPPHRDLIPIFNPLSKAGRQYASVDPQKVVGIVYTDEPDEVPPFAAPDKTSELISNHVVEFLLWKMSTGQIPKEFLPIQSGVGNIGNAVMNGLGHHKDIPPFTMFTEVLQDSIVDLMESGKVQGASTCALTILPENLERIYNNMDFFAPRVVLRPQDISNNPTLARQLGVIAINTALEVDIYGNVNSTHVCGTDMMNGIGGSGDFERNGYLSIFVCPSIAKGGKISTIVPMCTHIDSSEHSVDAIITEQGIAYIRNLSPKKRAEVIIENCVHPMYKDFMRDYLASCKKGHIRHNLSRCFELHQNLLEQGAMLPGLRETA
ncbi:succinate CoA transferase [Dongshaea marina]|uniref:succinate CoA transferase n=1 Tax=Dongshaea marina TaxID=2047966 RepID=UPI000D3E840D|nr:succinate CoA transferase [Dongshaea marina]